MEKPTIGRDKLVQVLLGSPTLDVTGHGLGLID